MALVVKHPSANTGDVRDEGSIPCPGRLPGGGYGSPLQLLVISFMYGSVYISVLISQFIPPPLSPLIIIGLFSTSVTLFLFCK